MISPFRGSSMVEQPTVNRLVVGSNPTRGAASINSALTGAILLSLLRGSKQTILLAVGFEKVLLDFCPEFYEG
jgi:hypothetical protein